MKKGSLGWGSLVCVAWLCLVFAHGLGGEADAEFLEDFAVHLARHHRGVHLAAVIKKIDTIEPIDTIEMIEGIEMIDTIEPIDVIDRMLSLLFPLSNL